MKLALQVPALNHVRRGARARTPATAVRMVDRLAPVLVMAALLFNFALCFLNTRGLPISQTAVIIVEVAILIAAGLVILPTASRPTLTFFLVASAYLGFLRYFNPFLDLKIGIDVAIPVIFWVLGEKYGDIKGADRLVVAATALVLIVGAFEWFALDEYQKYFDIFQYYVDKGSADISQAKVSGTKLFVSGIRPAGEGREVFPGLGNHRNSSVFLEPIGAGNFGALVFFWAVHRFRSAPRLNMALIFAAAVIIILADTRLGAILCVVALISQAIPLLRRPIVLFLLPVVMPMLILYVTALHSNGSIDNSFMGRIYSSGRLIADWGPLQWMALQPSLIAAYDSGYGYFLSNFGMIASLLLWMFAVRRTGLPSTGGFGVATALYVALSMCVTGSILSIKTAALVWFLNGVLSRGVTAPKTVDILPKVSSIFQGRRPQASFTAAP